MIQAVKATFANLPDGPVGVAVSGGGDSLALLHLALETNRTIHAATVDHGLRAESAQEARLVASACAALGCSHETLNWEDAPTGNLQAAARDARYSLLGHWAQKRGLVAVALGHTEDDQAETVLMRLARGSGVDGLSGMAKDRVFEQTRWMRPLLSIKRKALREFLETRNVTWIEDPSNDDPKFDRVKARLALKELEPLGITSERLVETARLQERAQEALNLAATELAKRSVEITPWGAIHIKVADLKNAADELVLRVLAHALCFVSSNPYRPRAASLERFLDILGKSDHLTLHGAEIVFKPEKVTICRELIAVKGPASVQHLWDGRWHISGPQRGKVRVLGELGLSQCPNWRILGASHREMRCTPAVWDGDTLVAAPCAGLENGYKAELIGGWPGFDDLIPQG